MLNTFKTPSLVTITIMTTITVFIWIGYSVYKVLISPPDIDIPQEVLEPLSPALDVETLAEISEKVYFEEGSTGQFSATVVENETETSPEDVFDIELILEEEEATRSSSATDSAEF